MSSNRSSRGDGGSQRSSFNGSSGRSQSRQSFYRGSDSSRSGGDRSSNREYDRSSRDGDSDRGSRDRDSDGNRNQASDRDRDGDRGSRDRNFSDRDGDRGSRDRDFSDRGDRDRGSRDRDFSDRTRRDWGGFDRHDLPFRSGWWDSYGWDGYPRWAPWRFSRWRDRPYYWWGWSSPRGLTDWLVYGFARPLYWDYGRGGNIWYDDDYVYYDGQRTMPADDYYDYLCDLANDVPNIDQSEAEKMDWKPLGVFAVRRENDSDSSRTLQLAVNRDGVITGTYYIQDKKEARPVAGRVDENSQRATWTFTDSKKKDEVVFETSVYNLTRSNTNVMVHFGPKASDAEIWQLVRLEQPESDTDRQTSQL